MNRTVKLAGLLVIVAAAGLGIEKLHAAFAVTLPRYQPADKTVWLDQNWTAPQREWFHHADQGTLTFAIPYEWFMALEQPEISLSTAPLLSDPVYLDRFGFIPGGSDDAKQQLPVGFARGGPIPKADGSTWPNPRSQDAMTGIGLTCAACHTGRFTYQKTAVLIDGGPALTNLDKLRTSMGLSLLFTRWLPFRFERFAERVLGPGADAAAKSALRGQLDEVLKIVSQVHDLDDKVSAQSVEEGYGRLDALNRIGNTVFGLDLNRPENYVATSAPVHFPRIWNAPWFDWVQYNGSIQQPMVRNAGEAMGVAAHVNLTDEKAGLFSSGVQVKTLVEMEHQLAGDQPDAVKGFSGLLSPKWPAGVLPPIDTALAAKGAELYKSNCQGCHMAPVSDPAFWASERWLPPNAAGQRYLDLEMVDISHVGTDPAQAQDMQKRRVALPASLGLTSDEFGPALGQLVQLVVTKWYDGQQPPIDEAARQQMNGNRPNGIRAELKYKVRPLDGVWATPPYLHNGSVPTLYALLSPVAERPRTFYLGNREYDPVNVGYRTDPLPGGFEFDTSVRGNSNSGHQFAGSPGKEGVIGRLLSPDERRALIEYLKTL